MSANLEFSFDVGHDSIGWAVLQTEKGPAKRIHSEVSVLGCGTVMFGADDCLASKRRGYRRQRRHARATRQRIARMEKYLAHLKVLTREQLQQKHRQAGGNSVPWFVAARILASEGAADTLLGWPALWDVLRWYAHNRGYDGNRRWSARDAEAEQEDTEKEKTAIALMEKHGTHTMAETLCKVLGLDPKGEQRSSAANFKRLNAAFPRHIVEREARRLLEFHRNKLPAIDETFVQCLFADWKPAKASGLKLPGRYRGGLLFGQLVPRFENRIISTCPISGEKVPSKNCPEFFRFRWAMTLANVRVGSREDKDLRELTAAERQQINAVMIEEGAMTPKALKEAVRKATACSRDNLDTMLMHPDAKEALLLDPVQKLVRGEKLATLWPTFSPRVQKRARDLWRRGKSVTLQMLCNIAEKLGEPLSAFEAEVNRLAETANTNRKKGDAPFDRAGLLATAFQVRRQDGRAAYARPLLVRAYEEVMAGKHPKTEGNCLFITEKMREAQAQRNIDHQTNNHLVRHRLLILERLLRDLVAEPAYANGDPSRVTKVTIEVNRDLREMSGKTAKQIEQDLGRRLANHRSVAAKLEKELEGTTYNGKPIPITAGLIRKARIAEDLGWTCPYTGQSYDALQLVSRQVDKDHIIPRSLRPSDSLDSLVITFAEVNRMKGQRTACQFVADAQSKVVEGLPQLSIVSLSRYKRWVEALESFRGHDDDKRRKKRRKELLLLQAYEEKEFVPRDLTVTSQLVRLGAQIIKKNFHRSGKQPVVISLPGSVTGTVRRSWDLLGCLELASPQVKDEDGKIKTKTEIRSLTHLHHALDACVLALASHFLPNNGGLWEAMLKRHPDAREKKILAGTHCFETDSQGRQGLIGLPESLKDQIRRRLAEKRVVQHLPSEMAGLRVEENTRGISLLKDGRVFLRQKSRDIKTGKINVKESDEPAKKVIGLNPGKLSPQKGVRVITDNFGVAILDHAADEAKTMVVIPYHKVWHRINDLRKDNAGKLPRVLRNGHLIRFQEKGQEQIWRVFSIKDTQRGIMLDIGKPDELGATRCGNRLRSFIKQGLQILETKYCGMPPGGTPP